MEKPLIEKFGKKAYACALRFSLDPAANLSKTLSVLESVRRRLESAECSVMPRDFANSLAMPPRVAVLGAGNMGSALAHALASQGCSVSIWDHFPEVVSDIQSHRENRRFLPSIRLHDSIRAYASAEDCVADASLVILSMPSLFIAETLKPLVPLLQNDALLLNVAKGFARGTSEPLICQLEHQIPQHRWVHLAGPCIANEFVQGQPAFITMASSSIDAAQLVADWFTGPYFHTSVTADLKGAALGGILKNVYAILLGCLNGLTGTGRNFGAAVMTACVHEMAKLAVAHGGQASTLYGLSGLGDLVATGTSSDSHNRRFGETLATGKRVPEILEVSGWLPEGVAATATACQLAAEKGVSVPLAQWVHHAITEAPPTLPSLLDAMRRASSGDARPITQTLE